MGFKDKDYSYEQKRSFRYTLQNYMHETFRFDAFKGELVLDLGCGSGIDSIEFARNEAQAVSVDFNQEAVKQTRDLFREAQNVGDFIQASATHLPFKDDVFGCVYSFGVLHHIPNVDGVLQEMERVLKTGGKFMGMLYNKDSLMHAMLLLRWGNKTATMTERVPNCPYTKLYSQREAKELLSRYFQDVEVYPRYNVIDTEKQRKVKFKLENGSVKLGWHLVVKGTKTIRE